MFETTDRPPEAAPSVPPEKQSMRVTPLDMRQQRFGTVMRGFDKTEVVAFLTEAADDFEQTLRELDRVRQELNRTEALLSEHREREANLRNTLLTAQRVADEIRAAAEQEARRIMREAEGRADLLLQKAQARLEDVEREINELRLTRRDAESSLEATIAALRHTLDFVRSQAQDREERILLHRPRQIDSASGPARSGELVREVGGHST
jgi:cell division initiation protein